MNRRQIEKMALVFMVAIATIATGQVPQRMSFQCILTNASGARQTGTFSAVFAIYDVSTGGTPYGRRRKRFQPATGFFRSCWGSSTPCR